MSLNTTASSSEIWSDVRPCRVSSAMCPRISLEVEIMSRNVLRNSLIFSTTSNWHAAELSLSLVASKNPFENATISPQGGNCTAFSERASGLGGASRWNNRCQSTLNGPGDSPLTASETNCNGRCDILLIVSANHMGGRKQAPTGFWWQKA